jgi:hypothetical protein
VFPEAWSGKQETDNAWLKVITMRASAPQVTGFDMSSDRNPRITFAPLTGRTNQVQASTNLLWWDVLTNIPNPAGVIIFVDREATNFDRRFYRIGMP